MGLMQFVRIFWARRWLILAATVTCLIGALIVTAILPPRWDAHSRVMLNLLKPDPVTGQIIGGTESRIYAQTQIELITDTGIAGQVAEQLGWLTDPALQAAYQKRSRSDQRDFRSWLSELIVGNSKARLIEGSNILEISYTGTSAANAKAVADVLRKVYIQDSLLTRREEAERNAEWYEQQTIKVKADLDKAVDTETAFEKANGVVMANDKVDADTARFQALSAQPGLTMAAPSMPATTQAGMELTQIDAQISAVSKILGPNNPEMMALRSKRAAVETIAAQEKQTMRAAVSGAGVGVGAYQRAVTEQRSKIIADSPKIGRLTQLQNDVNLKRMELERVTAKTAQFREESLVSDAGITPLGPPSTPKGPSFPNYLLIIPGAIVLGAGLGIMVALLMELLGRRVRGVEDLSALSNLPLVGVIRAPKSPSRRGVRSWFNGLITRPRRRKVAVA